MAVAMLAPYGSWESPITTDAIVADTIRFYEMGGDARGLYWTELHPQEKGRLALVWYLPGEGETPLATESSVRSRVHEYGGGAFCLHEGTVYFSDDTDRQLYSLDSKGNRKQLTHSPNRRYADGNVAADGKRHVWVCEEQGEDVENFLVMIDERGEHRLTSGHDFYANPRFSPDGKQIAFLTWDFPNMPWDGTTLWLGDIDEQGALHNLKAIAGGPEESVCQVQWSPEGTLHFVSDRTGFWNLYRYRGEKDENLCKREAEFGVPAWVFGRPTYAFLEDGSILTLYVEKGVDHLGRIDPENKELQECSLPFTSINNLVVHSGKVYFFGGSPTIPSSLIGYDPNEKSWEVVKASCTLPVSEEWISLPETIEYPSLEGKKGYAFYYPPKNPHYKGLEGAKPPLIVKSHGGPTSRSYGALMLEVQYWTSRGYAFVDVNYGGSTGYGREYFKRLEGNWGIVDVEDCISAAKSLVDRGLADGKRLLIRGGSAGGYTTLAALAHHNLFAAGTSYYGVSDLELLYSDDHKFESRYTDRLVGSFPEEIALIKERSPINHIEKFSAPLLLLQGAEDKVVPPRQSEAIYEKFIERGIPVGMLIFEGEGHGFRMAPNIKRALDAELYFYSEVLGIELPVPFSEPPVHIEQSPKN